MSQRLLLFLKAPRPGQVKTRLAACLGAELAAQLYRAFVTDLVARCDSLDLTTTLWVAPADGVDEVRGWLGPQRQYRPQRGADLGARMANALADTFQEGAARAVLVGSDLPDLPAQQLTAALEALVDQPAVIGPTPDGGYHLIGFTPQGFRAEVFAHIAWSTPQVYAQTLAAMTRVGLEPARLAAWPDVDTPRDLEALRQRLARQPETAPATWAALQESAS